MSASNVRRVRVANDVFQLTLSLRENRRQRARQRRFLVEGVRPINQAVRSGWPIEAFWYDGDRKLSGWAGDLLDSAVAPLRYELSGELMLALSQKDDPSELLAVAVIPDDDLGRIPVRADALVVIFDRPVSPGNLGSVIRSADAFGADGVIVTGHAADVYDPQTVRASMGSLFAVPVVRAAGVDDVAAWGEVGGLRLVGSSASATMPVASVDLAGPTMLVVGNETKGLSRAWRDRCDELVAIPMRGTASSLNAAAAASVLLYEADRQRRGARARDSGGHAA